MLTRETLSQAAKDAAAVAGFDLAGVAPVREEDFPEIAAFEDWIKSGHAAEMKYMAKRTESGDLRRSSATNSAPWARSVVVCAMNYNTARPYSTAVKDRSRGWISRYAWGRMDYHHALMPRLEKVEQAIHALAAQHGLHIETRRYVDTGPILERVYAKYAGIGWIGKNTCIINQRSGSWLFLGVILTSLEMAPDAPPPERCGSCTRCIDACPTDALVAPGQLDSNRCIAYLTIENRGNIREDLRAPMGHHVFGCDICQDVCPWNHKAGNAPATSASEFQPLENLFHPELDWLALMNEEDYRQTFRDSPVKRARFSGLKRNLAVAMGNSGNRKFIARLEEMAANGDPMVAEHAQWAIRRLKQE